MVGESLLHGLPLVGLPNIYIYINQKMGLGIFFSFKTYKAEVENQLEKKIKVIRSDRGGEYESAAFSDFCAQNGIVHQTTAPYTPQQNGVAERKNRTLKEMINSMLNSSGLPHNLWGEALLTANFILNRIHFKNSNKSPYKVWKIPPGSKPIGCKWIFKRKLKADGSVDKYKARLVAKGYRQKEGLDYFDTYSPVSRITSIKTLIAIASLNNMEIHQMDVKTAFLNGELDEEIYMEQPEGFVVQGQENKVCKLVKSLYGLKQAPKQWHEKFDHTMLSHGFKINECDKCVYIKTYANSCVFVCLYVDDMLIMETSKDVIMSTKKLLRSIFDMKDLGLADVILGIQIKRNNEGYILTQSHYVEKILNKYDQSNCKVAVTPFDANCKLKKNTGDAVSQLQFSQVIGSLMYLMNATRPDIAYSVSRLSRYTSNPGKDHWEALVRVLRYLKYTITYGLHYTKYPPVLEGYSDANWISDNTETKSTSGYVFTLGGAAISWKSSKQTCIARSTMESEFIALDKAAEEAEWLRNFLEDIPVWHKPVTAICIHCDSMAAQARAKSNIYNGKSRHIRRRHNTIKRLLSSGVISIQYIKSKANLADPLTKGLPREQVKFTSRGMGLKALE